MSRSQPPLRPEVRALLDRERPIPPVPASVRARSLARARAALVAGRLTPPAAFNAVPRPRWGVVMVAAFIATAAVAATAYEVGAHRRSAVVDPPAERAVHGSAVVPAPSPSPSSPAVTPPSPPPEVVTPSPGPTAASRVAHSLPADPGPDELLLLRQARTAVARHDFATALGAIAEHARRFRSGRLVEEREALRVRALSGLGRTDEARRAADSFEVRFPRSVLLPAVSHMPASDP